MVIPISFTHEPMAPMLKPMRLPVTKAHKLVERVNDAILLEEATGGHVVARPPAVHIVSRRPAQSVALDGGRPRPWWHPRAFGAVSFGLGRSHSVFSAWTSKDHFKEAHVCTQNHSTCRGESHHKRVQLLGRTTKVSSEALRPCHISHLLCCASLAQDVICICTSKML